MELYYSTKLSISSDASCHFLPGWGSHVSNSSSLNLSRRRGRGRRNRRTSSLRFSIAAAAATETATRKLVPISRRNEPAERVTSAMEQLDIERGVCIPFRKYTPETVGTLDLICHCFGFAGVRFLASLKIIARLGLTLGQEQGSGIEGVDTVANRPWRGDRLELGPLLVGTHLRLLSWKG